MFNWPSGLNVNSHKDRALKLNFSVLKTFVIVIYKVKTQIVFANFMRILLVFYIHKLQRSLKLFKSWRVVVNRAVSE